MSEQHESENRKIFAFWDGAKTREVDPMEAGAALESECPSYAELIGLLAEKEAPMPPGVVASSLNKDKQEASAKLLAATRKMFGVTPFASVDGVRSGLTQEETFGLLSDFLIFLGGLAAQARPFASSPPPDTPSTPADSPTGSSVDSGSAGV